MTSMIRPEFTSTPASNTQSPPLLPADRYSSPVGGGFSSPIDTRSVQQQGVGHQLNLQDPVTQRLHGNILISDVIRTPSLCRHQAPGQSLHQILVSGVKIVTKLGSSDQQLFSISLIIHIISSVSQHATTQSQQFRVLHVHFQVLKDHHLMPVFTFVIFQYSADNKLVAGESVYPFILENYLSSL